MIGVSFSGCQGWLHDAPGHRGVVLVGAHGFEELTTRRSWRLLGEMLSRAGLPVLRFDLPGTGDSLGDENEPGMADQWPGSVVAAADWMRSEVGVEDIVVVGLRFGALLALLSAADIAGLCGLGVLAPVASGRRYVRETATFASLAAAHQPTSRTDPEAKTIDVGGFRIESALATAMTAFDLAQAKPPRGLPVLLMAQRSAAMKDLGQWLLSGDCAVTRAEFAGYNDMICDALASKAPVADFDSVVAWVQSLGPLQARPDNGTRAQPLKTPIATEAAVTFGMGSRLAGVFTTPDRPALHVVPVVFCNSGMNHHIGWGRSTVRYARALAEQGVPSLRFDAIGIGDSAEAEIAGEDLPLYNDSFDQSLVQAIDWLEACGHPAVTVVGFCSGAYGAFHVARRDRRIVKAAIVNLQCFRWTPAIGYELNHWTAMQRMQAGADRSRVEDPAGAEVAGSRLVRARMRAKWIALRVAKRIARSRAWTRIFHRNNDVISWFEAMSARGAEIRMIYSRGDTGFLELERHTGDGAEGIARLPGVSIEFIDATDHNLTPRHAQDDMLAQLKQLVLGGPVGASADAGIDARV